VGTIERFGTSLSHPSAWPLIERAFCLVIFSLLLLFNSTRALAQDKRVPRSLLDTNIEDLMNIEIDLAGEFDRVAAQGGIIHLTAEENRLRFEIGLLAAERARLKISSKLLGLAKSVKEPERGGKG
jgi:hypothetical protein